MTQTPILSIEIDDTQYRTFQEKFSQFQADAAKAPEAWQATDEQVAIIRKRFEEMRASASEQNAAATDTEDKARKSSAHARSYVASITSVFASSKGFGGNIASATKQLATWTRHAATLTALFELGGAYGIGSLTRAASSRRYQAGGLGVSTGELSSFGVNFGRLGNVDGLLSGFNAAATDIRLQQPLQSIGVSSRGKDGAALFAEALPRIKDLVDRTDPKTFQASLRPYNLNQLGFTDQMLRMLRTMPRSEVMELLRAYGADVSSLNIPDDIGRKWQDLSNQLSRAEVQIQTGLAGSLVNITPGLTQLSESFVHLLDVMLDQPELKTWLDDLGKGITKFAETVGSPHAVAQFDGFLKAFEMTGKDFDALNSWFGSHQEKIALVLGIGVGARAAPLAIGAATLIARSPLITVPGALGAAAAGSMAYGESKGFSPETRAALAKEGAKGGTGTLQERMQRKQSSDNNTPVGGIAADLSGQSTYGRQNEHINPEAFIVHHTGGGGTPEGVISTLNQRGLGVQYVMGRDGSIYQSLPDGSRGAHILPGDVDGLHLSNSNTIGMEVIAKDDADVTAAETKAGVEFYKELQKKYPGIHVYGHGYVNPGHKQATEGKTIVDAIHAAEKMPDDPKRDAKEVIRNSAKAVPLAQRGFLGAYSGRDAPAPQSVTVHDNTAGSTTITVAH